MRDILIVEDELIIALLMERMVTNMGHNVVGKVTSGEKAVQAALDLKPDIILMDIRLEGQMDGIEAMKEISKESSIPVIYVTGNTDRLHRRRMEQTGYLDFLTKPITPDQLLRSFSLAS